MPELPGWFAFLLRHWVKQYIYDLFPSQRVSGFNFDGAQVESAIYREDVSRLIGSNGGAYRRFLSKPVYDTAKASGGAVLDRLGCIYDEICTDEVHDMVGYDLEFLQMMLESRTAIHKMGNEQQSLTSTDDRDPKNSQYRDFGILSRFTAQESAELLTIRHSSRTFRSIQAIATSLTSPSTPRMDLNALSHRTRQSRITTEFFAIATSDFPVHQARFSPQRLRDDVRRGTGIDADLQNLGVVKGRTWKRVAIAPTATMINFSTARTVLTETAAFGLHVAVTCAEQSAAFIVDDPASVSLPCWIPDG